MDRQRFHFRSPLDRHGEGRWEGVGSPFLENLSGGGGRPAIVEAAKHLYQKDVENIASPAGGIGCGTSVELLRNLLRQTETSYRRRHVQPQLEKSLNLGFDEIDFPLTGRTQIDIMPEELTG